MALQRLQKVTEELKTVENEFFRTTTTLVMGAFTVVAALAWNTAITKMMERYVALRPESSVVAWLLYAIGVTIVTVLVTTYVGRLNKEATIDGKKDEPASVSNQRED